ncbi:RecQ family ATP-dependent DNA helicase [Psychroflexus aestuariivivens]|uniref:RecQ family ATP-dependent DNA helicase n=1 Tax=Psychroflexus aestuariivivens TaxID=1795040 RepID=UPI000FD95D7D|nr:RecQ family ATP-dependent DNA helicase [Psychroflexus aestuariivivens]
MKLTPETILKTYWGFENFKPAQKKAVDAALSQKDACVFLPTGGGKSICFQVPALTMPGICIVISPLLALMKDQVENLKSKGIKAIYLEGGMNFKDVDQSLDNCIYGNYKFLYLSPERLQQEIVQARIGKMNVNLIAIDEAHCISQWGHDFRPAYRNISLLREIHPGINIMALTATATASVKKDIAKELQLEDAVEISESFKRSNIALKKIKTADKHFEIINQLQNLKSNSIVYVRNRSKTVEIAEFLNKNGFKADFFHGGIYASEKNKKLKSWLEEETQIMVATNAFGMGIDKSNVGKVIHYHLPESLESYFQEAGRAGRDDTYAEAVIIYNDGDKIRLQDQFIKTVPDFESLQNVYKALTRYFRIAYGEGENEIFDFNFYEFCKQYQLKTNLTYNTLNLLDRLSVITLSKTFQKKSKIKFLVSSQQVLNYIEDNNQYALLTRTILRTYGGVFDNELVLNVKMISKKTGFSEQEIFKQLEALHQQKILDAKIIKQDMSITFLLPREDKYTLNPLKEYTLQYRTNKLRKAEYVLDYVDETQTCLQKFVLNYFDENFSENCKICSVCIQNNQTKTENSKKTPKNIQEFIISKLKDGEKNSKEIINQSGFENNKVLEQIQKLLEYNIIEITHTNTYKLKA